MYKDPTSYTQIPFPFQSKIYTLAPGIYSDSTARHNSTVVIFPLPVWPTDDFCLRKQSSGCQGFAFIPRWYCCSVKKRTAI